MNIVSAIIPLLIPEPIPLPWCTMTAARSYRQLLAFEYLVEERFLIR